MSEMNTTDPLETFPGGRFPPGVPLSLVTICLDKDTREALKLFVESVPLVRLRAELDEYRVDDRSSMPDWIGDPPPDICLVDFDKDPKNAAATTEKIQK